MRSGGGGVFGWMGGRGGRIRGPGPGGSRVVAGVENRKEERVRR